MEQENVFQFGCDFFSCVWVCVCSDCVGRRCQVLGVAFGDGTVRRLLVVQVADGGSLPNLETLVVQLAPTECVLGVGDPAGAAIKQVRWQFFLCHHLPVFLVQQEQNLFS